MEHHIFLLGKLTISMAMFNLYKITRGYQLLPARSLGPSRKLSWISATCGASCSRIDNAKACVARWKLLDVGCMDIM